MIAAPFGQTGLAADTQLAQAVPSQPYVQLYVTCVATNASSPASAPFNIKSQTSLPRTVYSTFVEGNPKPRFNSLAYLLNLGERQGVVGDVHVVKRTPMGLTAEVAKLNCQSQYSRRLHCLPITLRSYLEVAQTSCGRNYYSGTPIRT